MAYTRKFIILKKEFSHMGGDIKGHGKLEVRGIRGAVTVNIENAEKEAVYNVLLLSNDKANSTFYLGKIFTDKWGKGKEEYNFSQRELENQRFPLERVSALMVMKENTVVLGGYINKDDKSIEIYVNAMPKPTKTLPDLDLYEEELEEDIKEKPEKEMLEDLQEEIEEVVEEPEEDIEEEELKVTMEETFKETSEEHKDLNHMKRLNQKNQTTMYILSILRFFPYIDPFKYNLSGFNWWIVELDKENEYKSFLPYFSYITGGNNKDIYNSGITCNELINKYNHYLFGLYNEDDKVKYYAYGIPGDFIKNEHPNNGEKGFNVWHEGKDVVGYWILYIDPMTGKPVYSQVPMIPID